jgi:hypothetical protein
MGRKSHNKTYNQLLEEGRKRANDYYQKHRSDILKIRRMKYQTLKENAKKTDH